MPVHQNDHWIAIGIDFIDKRVLHYDSLGSAVEASKKDGNVSDLLLVESEGG